MMMTYYAGEEERVHWRLRARKRFGHGGVNQDVRLVYCTFFGHKEKLPAHYEDGVRSSRCSHACGTVFLSRVE